ncbi:MAG: hypothetical protein QOH25_3129 [Acidobacteriota bacterium]|jgi:hypothetical protein|nr:hypothetical protein [Acidobacteriota bacterium]
MPTVDGSRTLLAAGADYSAGDWATLGAEASLDFEATANLNRGVDIGLGVEALARLDGSIRQYLAADVNGQAHAAARVRAQVQMPLDLFNEAGIAIRLQAVAEAAVGVQLAIGLDIGDFLELAGNDPRLRGVPLELLKIFLDEFTIQGGVMAKAAAAAMAYANIVATGSFIRSTNRSPGFTIAAEAGIGLKAGAGFRVFARFGVDDPRRLIRRTIDVAVDETLSAIAGALPPESHQLVEEATAPLKIALRCTYELGAALAENSGMFAAGDQGKFAVRVAQVGLEEAQRFVLERVVEYASGQLRLALRDLAFDEVTWRATQSQRQALRDRLNALPEEPFEATNANLGYWQDLVVDTVNLATALTGAAALPPFLMEPLAIVWCGAQLLMKSVERISVAGARASVIGASPVSNTAAFDGNLPAAPAAIRSHINAKLARSGSSAIRQTDALNYLLREIEYRIEQISPAAAKVLNLLSGGRALGDALSLVFSNIGAFAPGPDESVSAEASLRVLRDGLRTYINSRLDAELLPLIESATADTPEVRLYLDEVLLSTLRTVVEAVFDSVLNWRSADGDTQRALRELCSALLMRLFGSSLVVTSDVLLAHAQGQIQREIMNVAADANRSGGIAPTLARITGFDREMVADLVTETLEVCAKTFGPMPDERRARMRELMYRMIDTMPPAADSSTLEALKSAGMIGNAEAALELAQLLGEEIAGNLFRFIGALLTHVAQAILDFLIDTIAFIQENVEKWIAEIEDLATKLGEAIAYLFTQLSTWRKNLEDAMKYLLLELSELLGGFVEYASARGSLRASVKGLVEDKAIEALQNFAFYDQWPASWRAEARAQVRDKVELLLDSEIFDFVVDALLAASAEMAQFIGEVQDIEPGEDLGEVIAEKALARIEDALRGIFGDDDPSIPVNIVLPDGTRVPFGRVPVPIDTFVSVARQAISALNRFNRAKADAAQFLADWFEADEKVTGLNDDLTTKSAARSVVNQQKAEINYKFLDLLIVSPIPATVITGRVTIKLRIPGGFASLLSHEPPSHERLFVWVNEERLGLENARISFDRNLGSSTPSPWETVANEENQFIPGVFDSGLSVPTLIDPQVFDAGQFGLPTSGSPWITGNQGEIITTQSTRSLAQAQAEQFDARRRESLDMERPSREIAGRKKMARPRRGAKPGAVRRVGDKTLAVVANPASSATFTFTGENATLGAKDTRPAMIVEIDVPPSFPVHEGINTVTATLVPGREDPIVRTVSFLLARRAPASPDKPSRKVPQAKPDLPEALSRMLQGRGISRKQTADLLEALPQVRFNTWVTPVAERKKAVAISRKKLKQELAAAAKQRKEVSAALTKLTQRPSKPKVARAPRQKGESR